MRIALIVVGSGIGVLVLLAAIMSLAGSRMPANHTASRSLQLQKTPAEVYAVVRNFGEAGAWRSDVKKVEWLAADQFREHGSQGAVTYQIVEDVPNRKIVTKIMDVNLGYSGSWEYAMEGAGYGTLVTITERGVVSNPMFRFMSKYIFGHTATIDGYLKALGGRLS